jgi:hypothetical protein
MIDLYQERDSRLSFLKKIYKEKIYHKWLRNVMDSIHYERTRHTYNPYGDRTIRYRDLLSRESIGFFATKNALDKKEHVSNMHHGRIRGYWKLVKDYISLFLFCEQDLKDFININIEILTFELMIKKIQEN